MHYYSHNIGDFNNSTRHLTRVERALYRELIELYYDTEQPLQSVDFDRLSKRVLAHSEEEKTSLSYVLSEFFVDSGSTTTNITVVPRIIPAIIATNITVVPQEHSGSHPDVEKSHIAVFAVPAIDTLVSSTASVRSISHLH